MSDVTQIKLFPYQERVIAEKEDLDELIIKLNRVVCGVHAFNVPVAEKRRMQSQVLAMRLYSGILGDRIRAWETT